MPTIAELGIKVEALEVAAASSKLKDLAASAGAAEKSALSLSGIVKSLAAALAALKLASIAKESFTLAARYETLGVVMDRVGNTAGYSGKQLEYTESILRKSGITALESRNNITKMITANIELTKAEELSNIAKNAAVIANVNSSEAFSRLIDGIQRGEVEIMKTLGINTDFTKGQERLAASLGVTRDELTPTQKILANVNETVRASAGIHDVYADSLGTVGKAIKSLERPWENFKIYVGTATLGATKDVVDFLTVTLKDMETWASKNQDIIKEWSETLKWGASVVLESLGWVIERLNTIHNSFRLLKAYKSGDIDFLDFAGMDSEKAEEYLKYGKEYLELKSRLAAVKQEQYDTYGDAELPATGTAENKSITAEAQESVAVVEAIEREMAAIKSKADELNSLKTATDGVVTATVSLIPALDASKNSTESSSKITKEAARAKEKLEKEYESLLDKLEPLRVEQEEYNKTLEALAIMDPTKSTERYKNGVENLYQSLKKTVDMNAYLAESYDRSKKAGISYKEAVIEAMPEELREAAKINAEYEKKIDNVKELFLYMENPPTDSEQESLINSIKDRNWEALDILKNKADDTTEAMKSAFTGWAQNMAKDMNDVLWGADLTFGSMAESFGKMITQMIIQTQIITPMLDGLFKKTSGGGSSIWGIITSIAGNLLGGAAGEAGSAVTGLQDFGIQSTLDLSGITLPSAAGGYDVPSGVNPITQIHEREMVLPAAYADVIRNGGSGGGVVININNTANNTQATATQRSGTGGATIIDVLIEQVKGAIAGDIVRGNGAIPNAMAGTYGLNRVAGAY